MKVDPYKTFASDCCCNSWATYTSDVSREFPCPSPRVQLFAAIAPGNHQTSLLTAHSTRTPVVRCGEGSGLVRPAGYPTLSLAPCAQLTMSCVYCVRVHGDSDTQACLSQQSSMPPPASSPPPHSGRKFLLSDHALSFCAEALRGLYSNLVDCVPVCPLPLCGSHSNLAS